MQELKKEIYETPQLVQQDSLQDITATPTGSYKECWEFVCNP
jgi:hypothetical protein